MAPGALGIALSSLRAGSKSRRLHAGSAPRFKGHQGYCMRFSGVGGVLRVDSKGFTIKQLVFQIVSQNVIGGGGSSQHYIHCVAISGSQLQQ